MPQEFCVCVDQPIKTFDSLDFCLKEFKEYQISEVTYGLYVL